MDDKYWYTVPFTPDQGVARSTRETEIAALRSGLLHAFEDCPKCHGQYLRDGWTCHCYQCCFEWDLREPLARVLARARRKHRGGPPSAPPGARPRASGDRPAPDVA